MVRIIGGILGSVSGKQGQKVYRIMYGKPFSSNRPGTYNYSKSEKAVSARNKFSTAVKFAKYVNSFPELSITWKKARIKGANAYSRIIKHNAKAVSSVHPTIANIITPQGFPSNIKEISFSNDALTLSLNQFQKEVLSSFAGFSLFVLLSFHNPQKSKDDPFLLSEINQTDIPFNEKDDDYKFIIELNETHKTLKKKYRSLITYIAVVCTTQNSGKYSWSSTFAKEI